MKNQLCDVSVTHGVTITAPVPSNKRPQFRLIKPLQMCNAFTNRQAAALSLQTSERVFEAQTPLTETPLISPKV